VSDAARGRALEPGTELDGFVLEAVAGRGGMGVVYRARQRRPDRIVALKVIASELAEDPKFRARFEREARIAAQIEHPNVIPVHSAGEADGVLCIAMRFVNGTDMRALLAQEGGTTRAKSQRRQ
jgi:serine/threonine protein kinase